jgi:predicted alpha/beta superfamily hydrolase
MTNRLNLLGILLLAGCAATGRPLVAPPATAISPARLEIVDLQSRVFDNSRKLRVWLPTGYDDPANRDHLYPVLYLNDGQNLFDGATAAFGSEWKADETATELQRAGRAQAVVIVGIDNAGVQRAREYLPYPARSETNPKGARYGAFLATDVLPFVEARYRVERRREHRGFGGSSYGALIAMHVALSQPELFSRLLLESPSFDVDDEHMLRDVRSTSLALDRIFLGVGTNEHFRPDCGDDPGNLEMVANVREMASILQAKGIRENDQLMVIVEQCAVHNEGAWAGRFPAALEFLFPMHRAP